MLFFCNQSNTQLLQTMLCRQDLLSTVQLRHKAKLCLLPTAPGSTGCSAPHGASLRCRLGSSWLYGIELASINHVKSPFKVSST